jgi:translation initiation factor 2 subunit 1
MKEKKKFPEAGDLIIGTVKNIFNQGGFIDLDEYPGKTGMLHITEISLKWVRNIRDYIKEGQKVVLVVLRIDEARGHIDLSLRRVNDAQRKQKLQEVKQLQRAKKLIEMAAKELEIKDCISGVEEAFSDYESIYDAFEAIAADKSIIEKSGLDKKLCDKLLELIDSNIKPPEVEIVGYIEIRSFEGDGIKHVRAALNTMKKTKAKDCEIGIKYVSAPRYRINVKAKDYKSAEKAMKASVDAGIKYIESKKGFGEFRRELDGR